MSAVSTRKLAGALTAKGFQLENTHHEMYWLYVDGKRSSVRTRISYSAREYDDGLLSQMAKQTGLKRSEFDDLIECPLSAAAYVQLLEERGLVTKEKAQSAKPPDPGSRDKRKTKEKRK